MYAWEAGVKTTYYLRSLAATQVEKSSGAEGVKTRKDADTTPAAPVDVVTPAAPTPTPTPSPLPTPSPIQKEQLDAAKVAKEKAEAPKKKYKLHVAEDSLCESCE
jgi:ribonucleoside-diphosphate reductase alpha chain